MPHRSIVVIGASAGGLQVLQDLLRGLPRELDAAVMIVLHTSKHAGSLLPGILDRGSSRTLQPADGTRIEHGSVYVAPPDHHMIVEDGVLRVIQGPRENLHRPAIDPLFRSAAAYYGPRVIGVILSGLLDDGTSGLMAVQAAGGVPLVQDPETAMFDSMPRSALQHVRHARMVTPQELPQELVRLVNGEIPAGALSARGNGRRTQAAQEARIAEFDMSELSKEPHIGKSSVLACPDCGGVLWEQDENGLLRYRCRVGHAFTARHLETQQHRGIESALWAALRALQESASLYRRMAERARNSNFKKTAELYDERVAEQEENSKKLSDFLLQVNGGAEEEESAETA